MSRTGTPILPTVLCNGGGSCSPVISSVARSASQVVKEAIGTAEQG